jgi:hypothetical protein
VRTRRADSHAGWVFADARLRVIEARFIRLVNDAFATSADHVEVRARSGGLLLGPAEDGVIVDLELEVPMQEIDSVKPSLAERSDPRLRLDSNQRPAD